MEDIYGVRERVNKQLEDSARAYWDRRSWDALKYALKRPEDEDDDADEPGEEELEELSQDLIDEEKKEEKQ